MYSILFEIVEKIRVNSLPEIDLIITEEENAKGWQQMKEKMLQNQIRQASIITSVDQKINL